jgi:membrane-associated phospholipid phosphatase
MWLFSIEQFHISGVNYDGPHESSGIAWLRTLPSRGYWRMKTHHGRLRRLVVASVFCYSLLTASVLRGQEAASGEISPTPDDPAQTVGSSGGERDVSLSQLPANFLDDQKNLWLFPGKLAQGRHWLPTIAVAGVTAGLLSADPHDVSYFRTTTTFHGFNQVMSGTATSLEIGLVPAALYIIGRTSGHPYAEKTALFAGEAVADSLVVYGVINAVTRRLRPADIPPQGSFSHTFFKNKSIVDSSFPSGHTIAAFAVATVIARRYKSHRWVPWVTYGVAGVIGLSRITSQSHFPADVFLGAALGYSISRFDVLHGN